MIEYLVIYGQEVFNHNSRVMFAPVCITDKPNRRDMSKNIRFENNHQYIYGHNNQDEQMLLEIGLTALAHEPNPRFRFEHLEFLDLVRRVRKSNRSPEFQKLIAFARSYIGIEEFSPHLVNRKILRSLRKARGWSQTKLADKINRTQGHVSQLENWSCIHKTDQQNLASVFECHRWCFV